MGIWSAHRLCPPRRNTPGFVYVMAGDNDFYKIGSTVNPKKRLWQVSDTYGVKVQYRVLLPVPNMSAAENYLHCQYKDSRVYLEWFDLSHDEISEIAEFLRSV